MKYKVILFDQDGTLADTLHLIAHAIKAALKTNAGLEMDLPEIVSHFGPSEEGVLRTLLPHQHKEAFDTYLQVYEHLHDSISPTPFDGVRDLLESLQERDIPMGLITGKSGPATQITLQKFALLDYFNRIETGSPEGSIKREALKRMQTYFGVTAQECLYIGDEASDVRICQEAGVPIASAAWASTAHPDILESINPGMVFYRVQDLQSWLLEHT